MIKRLSLGLAITHQDPGHTHFDVFASVAAESDDRDWPDITRGRAGSLTLRTEEFRALIERLRTLDALDTHVDVYELGESQHPCTVDEHEDTEAGGGS